MIVVGGEPFRDYVRKVTRRGAYAGKGGKREKGGRDGGWGKEGQVGYRYPENVYHMRFRVLDYVDNSVEESGWGVWIIETVWAHMGLVRYWEVLEYEG